MNYNELEDDEDYRSDWYSKGGQGTLPQAKIRKPLGQRAGDSEKYPGKNGRRSRQKRGAG